MTGHGRLDPQRATFAKTDADFDPTPFLGVFAAACYIELDLLHRRRLPLGTLPVDSVASGPQRGLQQDIIQYLMQWDARHRLLLEAPWTTSRDQQGSLFAVPKNESQDRIVFNRVPRNGHEVHLPGYARYGIGGHDLTNIILPPGAALSIFSDDLSLGRLPGVSRLARARRVQRLGLDGPRGAVRGHSGDG